jgi:PTH1 family peptidyl-tRNA hydrolase
MQTLIFIGIGNPDPEYRDTRHNIGFSLVDHLARKLKYDDFSAEKKLNALVTDGTATIHGKKVRLVIAKPLSYVNATGVVAAKMKTVYKVTPEHITIIHDDLDIPFGNTKISFDKNSGGHRGIKSIITLLKTKKFYRLRIGTATRGVAKARQQTDKKRDEYVRDFVLSKFTPSEREELKGIFKESLIKLGIEV